MGIIENQQKRNGRRRQKIRPSGIDWWWQPSERQSLRRVKGGKNIKAIESEREAKTLEARCAELKQDLARANENLDAARAALLLVAF